MTSSKLTLPLKPVSRFIKIAMLSSVLLPAGMSLAMAESPPAEVSSVATQSYNIAAGSLDSVLNEFGNISGEKVMVDRALTKNKSSAGVSGNFTSEQALKSILANSGMSFKKTASGSYVLNNKTAPHVLSGVVVKAQLQERTVQKTQTSVSVITGEKLDRGSNADIYDVANITPGINASAGEKGFAIRGIREVNVMVDGLSLATLQAGYFGPYGTWDLEQVEILRGAQSTQAGRNSLGGAISIGTANPTFEQETKLRADYGTANTSKLALAHNQPLIDDVLAIRIAGEVNHSDGYIENTTRNEKDYDARDLTNGRIKVLYKPVEKLEAVFGYSYTDNKGGEDTVAYDSWKDGKNRYSTSDHEAKEGAVHNIASLDLKYELDNNWTLFSKTGQLSSDYVRVEDSDLTSASLGYLDRKADSSSFTQELKATFNNDKIRSVFGLFYTSIENDADTNLKDLPVATVNPALAPFNAKLESVNNVKTEIDNKAIFGELEYDISSKWTVLVGARYDQETNKHESSTNPKVTDYGTLPPPLQAAVDAAVAQATSSEKYDSDYDAFLPKAGVIYNFNERLSLGATAQKGYKAGGAGISLATAETFQYDPEYTNSYELALRSVSLSGDSVFNVNAYHTNWSDMQVVVIPPGGPNNDFTIENAGSSTLYGLEVGFSQVVNDSFNFFANAAYSKTEYDKYVTNGADYAGNSFVFAPELMASIGLEYAFTDNWVLSADANYQSEAEGNNSNVDNMKVPGRTLVNAKFGYEANNWSASIYSRNLTNEQYVTQYLVDSAGTGAGENVKVGTPMFVGLQVDVEL